MKKRFIAFLVIVFLLILPSTLQAKSSDTNINNNKLKGYTYYTNNSSISNENTIYVKYYTDDIVKFQIKDDYVIVKLKDVEDNIRYKFDILENRGMSYTKNHSTYFYIYPY